MAVDYKSMIGVPGTAGPAGVTGGIAPGAMSYAKAREKLGEGSGSGQGPKRIGAMRRQFVKERFRDMMEGNLVSDRDKRAYEQAAINAAMQTQAAQDLANQRVANAMAAGNPVLTGQLKKGAEDIGEASLKAQTTASGKTEEYAAGLKDAREARALGEGRALIASNKEDVTKALDLSLNAASSALGALT